jgi:hypothetical protein
MSQDYNFFQQVAGSQPIMAILGHDEEGRPIHVEVMDEALLAENFQVTVAVSAKLRRQKPVFSNTSLPLRVNLAPRGELCPLVRMFTPAFTSRSEHSLFRKMEGRKEGLPPGDNFTHRGQSSFWGPASLLWVIFRPWG